MPLNGTYGSEKRQSKRPDRSMNSCGLEASDCRICKSTPQTKPLPASLHAAAGLPCPTPKETHAKRIDELMEIPMKVDGRCHCGYITYEAEIDPEKVMICHCTDCQTLTGSA